VAGFENSLTLQNTSLENNGENRKKKQKKAKTPCFFCNFAQYFSKTAQI